MPGLQQLYVLDSLARFLLKKSFDESVSRPASRKPIPAPDDERHEVIRKLILARVGPESIGGDIREAPLELIRSTADSAIFLIVEQYYMFRDRGLDEPDAVRALNESQTATLAIIGQELPMMNHPATLIAFEYRNGRHPASRRHLVCGILPPAVFHALDVADATKPTDELWMSFVARFQIFEVTE